MTSSIDTYVRTLRRELWRRFIVDERTIDEVRAHLLDAAERARERGESVESADALAIARVGEPAQVAEACAADCTRVLYRVLLCVGVAAGAAIAYVDSRPHWDDTGITAGALLITAAVLGSIGPRRPWLWALAVGLWIPGHALIRTPALGTLPMLLVLAFPMAGAYVGRTVRRAIGASEPS